MKWASENTIDPIPVTTTPLPIHFGMCRCVPKYETNITVTKFPISKVDAIIPVIRDGISKRFSMVVMTELK